MTLSEKEKNRVNRRVALYLIETTKNTKTPYSNNAPILINILEDYVKLLDKELSEA